ncbi:MAG: dNTP triphosphohydrolase, partial [candidate division Zixibacteria bacterium]|nr:dNTP triphosphohydrolase [candidate division Zixibacteria bacterium]
MNELDAIERRRYPAAYAAMSGESRGRKYPIAADPYRTEYQRDRDRIIHSTAFRRLQHKTQVFSNLGDESDHYRTRLTHTIEVAQISRTIARSLGLNEDLAEAVALAHDLGHTPFGHAGEEVLNELTADSGGFNHNQQSLRVVDYLEKRYPGHFGLNLTYELREAIIKHETVNAIAVPEEFNPSEKPLLEGQIVNLADEIAYSGHDVDDGLASELLSLDMLCATGFLGEIMEEIESHLTEKSPAMIRYALVRGIVNRMVVDLVAEIGRRLKDNNIQTVADVRHCQNHLVAFSDTQDAFNRELRGFLNENIYRHPDLD